MNMQNLFIALALVATLGLATTALAGGWGHGYGHGYGHGGGHMMSYGSASTDGNTGYGPQNCPGWNDSTVRGTGYMMDGNYSGRNINDRNTAMVPMTSTGVENR